MNMMHRRKSALLMPAGVLLANVLNMVGIVVLPKLVDPHEFALFSLASSLGLLLVSIFYEWSRGAIVRYSVAADPAETDRRRAILRRANTVTSILLLSVAAVCWGFGSNRYALIVSMACLFAVSQALFEARQALFRADFHDVRYAASLVARAFAGLMFMCAVAFWTNSGFLVMCAWAFSFVIVLFTVGQIVGVKKPKAEMDWSTFRFLFVFGIGITLSAIATAALQPLVRLLAPEFVSLTDSGKLVLAMDISQKIIGVIGVSINVITLQATIRARELGEEAIMLQRTGMQLSVVLAVLVPTVLGFLMIKPEFTSIFVPEVYRDVFSPNVGWCMLAAGILGFRAFALDTIFVVLGRPYLGLIGPLTTMGATLIATYLLLLRYGPDPVVFSQGFFVGVTIGATVSFSVARYSCQFPIEWGNYAKIALSALLMSVVLSLCIFKSDLIRIVVSVLVGGGSYFAGLLAMDAMGLRQTVRWFLAKSEGAG